LDSSDPLAATTVNEEPLFNPATRCGRRSERTKGQTACDGRAHPPVPVVVVSMVIMTMLGVCGSRKCHNGDCSYRRDS
jgi:hypothetical protein